MSAFGRAAMIRLSICDHADQTPAGKCPIRRSYKASRCMPAVIGDAHAVHRLH